MPLSYEFGPFRVDPIRRQLTRGGRPVPLTPKAFDTLVALVEQSGRTVNKDELLERIWAGTAVEENNLTQAISRLRKALELNGVRYIVTIPGEGYRFVETVRAVDTASETQTSPGEQPPAPSSRPRLMVLPFRVLRSDPETDFLAFSVPDAITTSLSGLQSLIVRSSMAARRFAGEHLDLAAIASEAAVDAVLCGTLLRDGDELNVNAQLVDVPSGTVTWSQHCRVPLGSMFRLQDALTRRIVESLPVQLTAQDERALRHHVPASASAYELYLRANQLSYTPRHWAAARDLYKKCLDEDPLYAPAWARLGRIYRVLGLYGAGSIEDLQRLAREAFVRAFEIHPDLPLAHNLYTHLEVELGGATEAMLRLLDRARLGAGDAELFAGLVHACRYAGLLDAAVAAHEQAWRLDPQIRTGIAHAYWCMGEYEKAIAADLERPALVTALSLTSMGRDREAIAQFRAMERLGLPEAMAYYMTAMRATIEGAHDEAIDAVERMHKFPEAPDPCPRYYHARLFAKIGDTEHALEQLKIAAEGFFSYPTLAHDPWLDSLRGLPEFAAILQRASTKHRNAAAAFAQAGGDAIVGAARPEL